MCQNSSCGKVFSRPIKAMNLGSKDAEAYDACPYCLTEIETEQSPMTIEMGAEVETKRVEVNPAEVSKPLEEKLDVPAAKPNGCVHQFGYLSKRSSKEQIPEECMVCQEIVKCMLKAITS